MNTFISIGTACNVKYQINKINNSKETLFFDWLMVDMQSVISILKNHESIDNIINTYTVIKDKKEPVHGQIQELLLNHYLFVFQFTTYQSNIMISIFKNLSTNTKED